MPSHNTIALTGATGFLGRYVVRELLSRGSSVRIMVRDRDKAKRVLPNSSSIDVVHGDCLDYDAVASLVTGATACINTLGIIREAPRGQTFRKIHVQAVQTLVEACNVEGINRIAHVSAMGVSESGRAEYQRTKWEGEQLVRGSGMPWTIFRPSTIHGVDGELVQIVKRWVTGRAAPWFFLPYFTRGRKRDDVPFAPTRHEPAMVAPVAVEDVAWAIAECLERPETIGEIYNLSGPEELSWPEMLMLCRDAIPEANTSLQPMGIPANLAATKARIAARLGLGMLMPFDEGMAIMGAQDAVSERDKARAHLGFQPIAFSERLPQYAAAIGR
jgi:uncharacterized protein YbjT (DUF2867 family)